jgi:TolA-binding protein
MTMRTILTAAAIISSAGLGVSQSPASHDSSHTSRAPLTIASTQRSDTHFAIDGIDAIDATDAMDAMDAVDAVHAIDTVDAIDAVDAIDGVETTDAMDAFDTFDRQVVSMPPEPWAKADPADSLYRLAREALSRGDYKRAAEIFHRIPERYPQSAYAGQALY